MRKAQRSENVVSNTAGMVRKETSSKSLPSLLVVIAAIFIGFFLGKFVLQDKCVCSAQLLPVSSGPQGAKRVFLSFSVASVLVWPKAAGEKCVCVQNHSNRPCLFAISHGQYTYTLRKEKNKVSPFVCLLFFFCGEGYFFFLPRVEQI